MFSNNSIHWIRPDSLKLCGFEDDFLYFLQSLKNNGPLGFLWTDLPHWELESQFYCKISAANIERNINRSIERIPGQVLGKSILVKRNRSKGRTLMGQGDRERGRNEERQRNGTADGY